MSLHRAGTLVLALALSACTSVSQGPQPEDLVFATFASPNIPTPNDLALASLVTRLPSVNACQTPVDVCGAPPNAQVELLCAFRAAGGFPSDQEVPISIPFTAAKWDPAAGAFGAYVPQAAPAIDLATVTASTLSIYRIDVSPPVALVVGTDVEAAASAPGDCSTTPCKPGTLTIRKRPDATGSRRWPAGARITFAVRGGPSGVKTTTGLPISADSAVALTLPNKDLTNKENQPIGGIPDTTPAGACGAGTNADEVALLENVRKSLWNPLSWCYMPAVPPGATAGWNPVTSPQAAALCASPPPAANASVYGGVAAFPTAEIATAGAFGVAPAPVVPLADSGSGAMPFPSDFLLDASGKVRDIPTFCGGNFDPGTQSCTLSRAIATLEGFSTTAPLTFNTTVAVQADAATGRLPANAVVLLDLGPVQAPLALPVLLSDAQLATSGAQLIAASYAGRGAATTVALAQGIPFPPSGTALTYLPPLKENRRYALVVTDRLLAAGGAPFQRNTLAKILWGFTNPLSVNGKSQVPGVSDADAAALQALRNGLSPVLAALPLLTGDATLTKANVIEAYTIKTQPILDTAGKLAAIPYQLEAGAGQAIFTPVSAAPLDPQAALGLPAALFPNVAQFVTAAVTSFDATFPATGTLFPDLAALADPAVWPPARIQAAVKPLTATIAVPAIAGCTPAAPCAAPLVLFHHGINGGRDQVMGMIDSLAARGFVVAAIDMPYHGSRSFCKVDTECVTAGGATGTCTVTPATPGTPAHCGAGETLKLDTDLAAVASGNYFISDNFFRTRDAIRQDFIDQSALILALGRPPAGMPQPPGNPVAALALAQGVAIDFTRVYWSSISLGSIVGTQVAATNPRISRAALDVPGGTLVDVFTNSPAFQSNVDALFASIIPGYSRAAVTPGDPAFNPAVFAAYQQTLAVAKWILDPADPLNYASSLVTKAANADLVTALGPLAATTTQAYGQLVTGDAVVPTTFGLNLFTATGTRPTTIPFTTYTSATFSGGDPLLGQRAHGLLLDGLCFANASCGTAPGDATPKGTQIRLDLGQFLLDATPAASAVSIP